MAEVTWYPCTNVKVTVFPDGDAAGAFLAIATGPDPVGRGPGLVETGKGGIATHAVLTKDQTHGLFLALGQALGIDVEQLQEPGADPPQRRQPAPSPPETIPSSQSMAAVSSGRSGLRRDSRTDRARPRPRA